MTLSLSGIIIVQLLWIKNLVKINNEQFATNVTEAMNTTMKMIRKGKIAHDIIKITIDDSETAARIDTLIVKNKIKDIEKDIEKEIDIRINKIHNVKHKFQRDSIEKYIGAIDQEAIKKIEQEAKIIFEEFQHASKDLHYRLDTASLNPLLKKELANKGIYIPFNSQIFNRNSETESKNTKGNTFEINAFPGDVFSNNFALKVIFSDKYRHNLKVIGGQILISIVLTLIIVFTFAYTLHSLIKQKKISLMKSEFIKNMSHELKTPIATISLATDSIETPQVLQTEDKIRFFTTKIREENKRMGRFVENVLQMSLIEKEHMQYNFAQTCIHDLIRTAVSNIELLLKSKDGTIHLQLDGEDCDIMADEIHMLNVVYNLLDNAIKYTERKPVIEVITMRTSDMFILKIKDNGIGFDKKSASQIFDTFYRVPTQNIHNVKGYGLGLSYVKQVVRAHKGSIKVDSRKNEGSTFIIKLPLINLEK
ncbi:MAG: HAMP domain-containing histidine kinase [Bacteroidales bacterium]|nr:HAMP domain-containing histidine kinase [Bacteroidales bacterium]